MKRGEKVLSGTIILTMVLVLSMGVVSANWFTDMFKIGNNKQVSGNEGELASLNAKVNVTVKSSGQPPVVVKVDNVTFYAYSSGSGNNMNINQPIVPNLATTPTTFRVYFWAYFVDGNSMLPGTVSGQDVTSNVHANLSYGAKVRPTDGCDYWNTITNYDGLGHDAKNYSCDFTTYWSDEPRPNSWAMRFQIQETSGLVWSLVNGTQTLMFQKTNGVGFDVGGVNWTTQKITAGGINAPSDNVINIDNRGNIVLQAATSYSLRINATKLIGESLGGTFGASNFTAAQGASIAACPAAAFSEAAWSNLALTAPTDSLPPSRNVPASLGFCAKTANGVVPQSYSTSVVGGNSWVLDDYCNLCTN